MSQAVPPRVVRGCAAVTVFGSAALAVLFSFGGTVEMETFPGLRENRGPVVVWMLVFAAVVAAGGLALTGWRSRAARVATGCLAALVAVRLWTVAPVLHCWSYDKVSRADDGTYTCYRMP
ncbi:hypothetical protein [Streptomyces sp. NPDC006997]|uniref:hypothetical protein n=1 Tax=Streptomyces sp. NPDC006997 TaxID=3155356 RepID=UPI0033E6572A